MAAPRTSVAPRVIIFDTGYFLVRELIDAASRLELPAAVWRTEAGDDAQGEDYRRLLELIKTFRPDLVLTVNHLGFDAEGLLASVLGRLGLPAASWFVDAPAFILGPAKDKSNDGVFAFSWDRDHLPVLKALGFVGPRWLPLASSETFFRAPESPPRMVREIAFVGDSLTAATEKYAKLSGLSPAKLSLTDWAARGLERPSARPIWRVAEELGLKFDLGPVETIHLEALLTWLASRRARLNVLTSLPCQRLSIAGDEGWRGLVPGASLQGRVDYYSDLGAHYQGSAVNLNVTSAQMRGGLNQRVFDVPAARAFLLTDQKEQLPELFEPDREVVVYESPEEARAKALWHLERPDVRAGVAGRAWRRVQAEHSYRHRLATMLTSMNFGRRIPSAREPLLGTGS
jgi:spore maturation protein CgeB